MASCSGAELGYLKVGTDKYFQHIPHPKLWRSSPDKEKIRKKKLEWANVLHQLIPSWYSEGEFSAATAFRSGVTLQQYSLILIDMCLCDVQDSNCDHFGKWI